MSDPTLHVGPVKGRCPWCTELLIPGQIIWDWRSEAYHEGCLLRFLANRLERLERGLNPYGS